MKRAVHLIGASLAIVLALGVSLISAGGLPILFQQDLGPVTIIAAKILDVRGRMGPATSRVEQGKLVAAGSFVVRNPSKDFQGLSVVLDPGQEAGFEAHLTVTPSCCDAYLPLSPGPSVTPIVVVPPGREMVMGVEIWVRRDAVPASFEHLVVRIIEEEFSTQLPPSPPREPMPPSSPSPTQSSSTAAPVQE